MYTVKEILTKSWNISECKHTYMKNFETFIIVYQILIKDNKIVTIIIIVKIKHYITIHSLLYADLFRKYMFYTWWLIICFVAPFHSFRMQLIVLTDL